jgi:hypothetical protein
MNALALPLGKYWLVVFCVLMFCLSLAAFFVFLGLEHLIPLWAMITGTLISGIVPALFFRLKIHLFTKKVDMLFSGEFVKMTTADSLNETFAYCNVQYFSVSKYEADKASVIKFILRNGIKKRYIFFRQVNNDDNVLNNVLLYFSTYNSGKIQEEKIQISPGFFLTKGGKVFVAATGLIILAATMIEIIYKPKATAVSLLAVIGGYLQVKSIQMADKITINRFHDQERDSYLN